MTFFEFYLVVTVLIASSLSRVQPFRVLDKVGGQPAGVNEALGLVIVERDRDGKPSKENYKGKQ